MSLTPPEVEKLRDIERRLICQDPAFARRMSPPAVPGDRLAPPRVAPHGTGASRLLVWLLAGLASYIAFATIVVFAVAGGIGAGRALLFLAVDLIVPFAPLVVLRLLRRRKRRRAQRSAGRSARRL